MKRGRSPSCERESELGARPRRRQLRIQIPSAVLPNNSHSQSSAKSSSAVKESPSSLFSAASVGSIFGNIPPSPSLIIPKVLMTATSSPNATTNDLDDSHESQRPYPQPALRTAPPIQGLYFDPSIRIPQQLEDDVVEFCLRTYFQSPAINQVMLFCRANDLNLDNIPPYTDTNTPASCSRTMPRDGSSCSIISTLTSPVQSTPTEICNTSNATGLPTILVTLLSTLSTLLKPLLQPKPYSLLFPDSTAQARQVIINLYAPGEGISPHVDLTNRYGDGIIGVSFGSGCVMRFDRQTDSCPPLPEAIEKPTNKWELYLPERTVYVLTEEARYGWAHGIDKATRDYAMMDIEPEQGVWIDRRVRLSVTYRWLLSGADVVGPSDDD